MQKSATARKCRSLLLVVCFSLLHFSNAEYSLTAKPDHVEIGITNNVTLECRFTASSSSSVFSSISRLRILKEVTEGNYQIVAEIRETETAPVNSGAGPSAKITGFIGNVSASFLSISWAESTVDILGNYRCEIIGFKANLDVWIEKTPSFALKETSITLQDAIDLAIRLQIEFEQRIYAQRSYCDDQVLKIGESINAKMAEIESSHQNSSESFENALLGELSRLKDSISRLKNTGVFRYWPQGSYALLAPQSGCPENVGAIWDTGYRKFHTESTDRNSDRISDPSHLKTPALERDGSLNFVYQHFCVSRVNSRGPAWPRGSYCINRVNEICPSGFRSGYIFWQGEVSSPVSTFLGQLPDGDYTENATSIYYCCRSDGSPSNPIFLPNSRAFYLYRYNGTCQEVVGMRASSESVTFDTDSSQADKYENSYHPDGKVNDVVLEFCYYSPV